MKRLAIWAALIAPGLGLVAWGGAEASAGVAADRGAAITVAVSGVRSARGVVRVDICPQAQFLGDGCTWHGMAPAHPGTVSVRIEGVPPGDYAAQAFHDANNNDKVDRGLFGIPREGVGFSNDAPIGFHPPRWRDARFVHGGEAQGIAFSLRYW